MTILVLELRVPEVVDRHSVDELGHALAHDTATFASYIISFAVLGVFWYRHNHQYHYYRVITRGTLVLHFVQLAAAAFFPFCAALFGRYSFNPLSGVVYLGWALVYLWAALGNWVVAMRVGAMGPEITPAEFQRSRNRSLRGCLFMSALLAFYVFKVFTR